MAKSPKKAGRGMPTWLMMVGVCVVSAGAAVVAAAGVIAVMFAFVGIPAENKKKGDPIGQAKPADGNAKPKLKKEPEVEPEAPEAPPITPPAKTDKSAPVLIVELPKSAGRACLSADGKRVAYVPTKIGFFGYREGPAFDVDKEIVIDGASTPIHPLASSADGRLMAMTAGSREGPHIYVWNWDANRVEAKFPISNLATSCAFSPDGTYLATYVPRPQKVGLQYWLHFHEINTGRMPSQWILDSELNFVAFTPDSKTILFASERDFAVRTWKRSTARPDPAILFPQPQAKHFFARNSGKVAYLENANQLSVLNGNGMNSIGKIETDRDTTLIHAAGFSADNRFMLLGVQDIGKGEKPIPVWRGGTGHGRLVEIGTGKTVAVTEALDGVPDRVELASNGIGLLQSQRLRPRLYSFPTLGGVAVVKAPVTPADGFVPLFNCKDLTGWKPQVHPTLPGIWRVENGILTGSGIGKGGYRLYTERPQPKDFHLRLEARISNQGFGSLRFACPDGSILGFETPLNSNAPVEIKTGSLRAQIPNGRVDLSVIQNSPAVPDQWFTMDIIAQGKRIVVKVNGAITADIPEVAQPLASGHISLFQSGLTKLEFRRIEIKELKPEFEPPIVPADGFVPLFNGKDLTGWKTHEKQPGNWRVNDGILTCIGPSPSALHTLRDDYKNFHLRVEARINDGGAGAIFARSGFGPMYPVSAPRSPLGYRASVNNTGTPKTGKLYIVRETGASGGGFDSPARSGEWSTIEVIAEKNQIRLFVDGRETRLLNDTKSTHARGHIALFLDRANSVLEFRKIEIKEK